MATPSAQDSGLQLSNKTRSLVFSNVDEPLHLVHGLFVGVESYRNEQLDLQYSGDDAFGLWKAFGGETNPLLTCLLDEEATYSGILGAFTRKIDKVQKGDLLVLFVAGHGAMEFEEVFFLPHDFSNDPHDMLVYGIPATMVVQALSTVARRGVHVLVILDTCHSGAVPFDISRYSHEGGGGLSFLFSCSPLEYSVESMVEHGTGRGKNNRNAGNGIFTRYLIEGLEGKADVDGNGLIRLRHLFNYTSAKVREFSKGRQNPFLNGTLSGNIILKTLT